MSDKHKVNCTIALVRADFWFSIKNGFTFNHMNYHFHNRPYKRLICTGPLVPAWPHYTSCIIIGGRRVPPDVCCSKADRESACNRERNELNLSSASGHETRRRRWGGHRRCHRRRRHRRRCCSRVALHQPRRLIFTVIWHLGTYLISAPRLRNSLVCDW